GWGTYVKSMGSLSVNVQVDAQQDQRPQHRGEERRAPGPEGIQVRPVVVRRGHDPAGDQVERGDPADADPRGGSGCGVAHPSSSFSGKTRKRRLGLLPGKSRLEFAPDGYALPKVHRKGAFLSTRQRLSNQRW